MSERPTFVECVAMLIGAFIVLLLVSLFVLPGCARLGKFDTVPAPVLVPTTTTTTIPPAPAPVLVLQNSCAGGRIRTKDYSGPSGHNGRLSAVKLDTRFHDEAGCRPENTQVVINGAIYTRYGYDADGLKATPPRHDLCFESRAMRADDLGDSQDIRVYRDLVLICRVIRAGRWAAGEIAIPKECPIP